MHTLFKPEIPIIIISKFDFYLKRNTQRLDGQGQKISIVQGIYWELYKTYKYASALWGKIQSYSMLKRMLHIVTTVF
jgi:hypothetical protein